MSSQKSGVQSTDFSWIVPYKVKVLATSSDYPTKVGSLNACLPERFFYTSGSDAEAGAPFLSAPCTTFVSST